MSDDKEKSRSSSVDEYVTPSISTTASHTPDIIQPAGECPKEGIMNQEDLRDKLKQIPLDTLKEILTNQIDLEIRLKHKELKLTEEEIGKCESQMITLRKFFEIPNNVNFDNEPNDFTIKYYDLLNKSLSINYTNLQKQQYSAHEQHQHEIPPHQMGNDYVYEPVHSYRTRSTTSSLRPSIASSVSSKVPPPPPNYTRTVGCLHRRTDGVIVKLTCPDCHRSNFSSAQGFLNHSRIAHAKEYTSQDAAALKCGEILPDYEQDEEGLASLKNLKAKNIDPNKNLNVNEIYFNGLSNSLNTVHRSTVPTNSLTPPSTTLSKLPEASDSKPAKSELMKKLIKNGITSDEQQYQEMIKEVKDEVKLLHLFDDEEEVDENEEALEMTTSAIKPPPNKLNRRKSRGVMGISSGTTEEVTAKGPEDAAGPTNGTRSKSGGVPEAKRRKR